MFEKIRSIISEQLSIDDVDTITLDTSLTEDLEADSLDAVEVIMALEDEFGIVTRAGIHCAPLMHEYFGTKTQGMVRFSFSYYNTEEEVMAAADAVKEIARKVVEI